MARYTPEDTRDWIRTEGLEHYLAAQATRQRVLIVTGHLGAWEIVEPFTIADGYPMEW